MLRHFRIFNQYTDDERCVFTFDGVIFCYYPVKKEVWVSSQNLNWEGPYTDFRYVDLVKELVTFPVETWD